ncbi:MAG: hypothetical protein GXC78_05465 [Chitinophagaceae bacterium]|nr:hypothetical protein [Chitinophagaceae bacterium]
MLSFLPGENKRLATVLVHGSFWIAYTGITYFANYIADPSVTILGAILYMIPLLGVFYLSLYWIARYRKMGSVLSGITFVGTFVILDLITYGYVYKALPTANLKLFKTTELRHFIKYTILGYIQFYAYALLYYVGNGLVRKERELRTLQEEKYIKELENARLKEQELKTQYAFLRAQVNPHFLHNSLNTIFSKAQEYSDELAECISKLAQMMRYSFESLEYETDIVPLEKELRNLKLLIDINNIRFAGESAIDYTVEGEIDDQVVPPLSLITVVENAFKYGDLADSNNPLTIRVHLRSRQTYFYCKNKKRPRQLNLTSTNFGIANLVKRLDALFPNKYQMKTEDEEDFFKFELTINN